MIRSGSIVLFILWILMICIYRLPLSSHCWISYLLMSTALTLIWVEVFFFIWCFFDLIHIRHWFFTFFALLVFLPFYLFLFHILFYRSILFFSYDLTIFITCYRSQRWHLRLLIKPFILSKIFFWEFRLAFLFVHFWLGWLHIILITDLWRSLISSWICLLLIYLVTIFLISLIVSISLWSTFVLIALTFMWIFNVIILRYTTILLNL